MRVKTIITNTINSYFLFAFDFQLFLFLPMILINAIESKSSCQAQENGEIGFA